MCRDARPDLERDHVLLDQVAEADSCIESLGHDVDLLVLDAHFEPHVRVALEEARSTGCKPIA